MPRKHNLKGQRFGKLTVLEQTGKTQDGYILWHCQCDCGKEAFVNSRRLLRGTVTDCGCVPKKTARNGCIAEDLTGQRFGELTVVERAESRNGRTRWVCRCSCGNLHIAATHDLKRNHVKSCGCKQHLKKRDFIDITDQKFGRLRALYPTDRRDKKGSVFWHCRCECGTELDVTEDGLMHGNYRSCGCLRKEIRQSIHTKLNQIDGTCVEWLEKRKYRKDNTSGFRGVQVMKNGRFKVLIGFKKHRFYVGQYGNFEEAVAARLEAEKLIHGGFLKAYYTWQSKADGNPKWAEETPLIFEVEKINGQFKIITNMK